MAKTTNRDIKKLIPMKYRVENLVTIISRKRFLRRDDGMYVLMGGLTPVEYSRVKDYIIYDDTKGRYYTKSPKKVTLALLKAGLWRLDYLLAIKLHNAVLAGDRDSTYALNTIYTQLILQKEGNENAIDLLKSAEFRGDMFEWKLKNNISSLDISLERVKNLKVGERVVSTVIFENTKTGKRYLEIMGESVDGGRDGLSTYVIVWDYDKIKKMTNRTLVKAFDLGKYADTYAFAVGEITDVIEDSVENEMGERLTVRGIIATLLRYNIIDNKVSESVLASAQLDFGDYTKDLETGEFENESEARRWLDKKFFYVFREAKAKYGDFKKQAQEIEQMFHDYDKEKDDDIDMMFG